MGNDMTWEQKCRISALRAACASQFTLHGVPAHLTMPPDVESDEAMTKRILARAETFRVALLSDGALDYVPDDDETPDVSFTHSCIRCSKAIRLIREENQAERWEDVNGRVLCDPAGILMHTPVEPISTHCLGCGSSRKDTPLMINDGFGDSLQCNRAWHREL
jgi:hypothetical protein